MNPLAVSRALVLASALLAAPAAFADATGPGPVPDGTSAAQPAPVSLDALDPLAVDPAPPAAPDWTAGLRGSLTLDVPERPGLGRLMLGDFRRIASRENLMLLALGAGASMVASSADRDMTRIASGSDGLEDVCGFGDFAGSTVAQLGGAVSTLAIGHLTGNRTIRDLGQDLVRAQVLDQALTQGLKYAVSRQRPDGSNRRSFPSGHTSASFATATVLERHFGWKVGIPAYALATVVGVQRIQDRRHNLSDVLMGASLGIVAGRTVTIGKGDAKFGLEPYATTHGVGVSLVHIGRH